MCKGMHVRCGIKSGIVTVIIFMNIISIVVRTGRGRGERMGIGRWSREGNVSGSKSENEGWGEYE